MDQAYLKQFSASRPPASRLWLVVLLGLLCAGMAVACALLFMSRQDLERRVGQMKQLVGQAESAALQVMKEKDTILREKEKLQADTQAYMAMNNDLQKEKEGLQSRLKDVDALIAANKKESEEIKRSMQARHERLLEQRAKERRALGLVKQALLRDVRKKERAIQQERSFYHYDLGIAYGKSGLMRDAIREYEASIQCDKSNADAHYNLALLYKSVENNQGKAVEHFKKYLELKPDAEDAAKVRETVEKMVGPDAIDEGRYKYLRKVGGYDQAQ